MKFLTLAISSLLLSFPTSSGLLTSQLISKSFVANSQPEVKSNDNNVKHGNDNDDKQDSDKHDTSNFRLQDFAVSSNDNDAGWDEEQLHRHLEGCNAISVSGCEDLAPAFMGEFTILDETCEGRSYYKNSNGYHLYCHSTYGWLAGDGCGLTSVGAYGGAGNTATPFTTTGWHCGDNRSGFVSRDLEVECINSVCSATCGLGKGCGHANGQTSPCCISCQVGF